MQGTAVDFDDEPLERGHTTTNGYSVDGWAVF
jgi:hypothetical protein